MRKTRVGARRKRGCGAVRWRARPKFFPGHARLLSGASFDRCGAQAHAAPLRMMPLTPPRARSLAIALLLPAVSAFAQPSAPQPISVPRITHPGAGQTIYILMPDRFANGDPSNDTGHIAGGPEDHGFDPTRIGYHHGGDFAGLIGKLDYIQGLNVTTVWTTPPYKNNPVQSGSSGYHGYWPVDFLNVDPHLGTNADYRAFLQQAHARSLRVYLDIVVNHTADIIKYAGENYTYVDTKTAPTRDASGQPFDERAAAYNGLNDPAAEVGRRVPSPPSTPGAERSPRPTTEASATAAFPSLDAKTSFARPPVLPPGMEHAKNPAWLNDVTLYHNRGNSTFQGESATRGDFVGLDDVMTEHPRVVRGFIEVFNQWVEWGVDGFRIDTMRHANAAFWQAFNPALRAKARSLGRPDFIQFGEVMNEAGDVAYLSEFSTGTMPADSTTDFAFAGAARKFISQGGPAAALAEFFARDDAYTDHDSNVHASVTLLGNYDIGRWGYFLLQDNPGASPAQLADLVRLGHGLMYLSRGMPVLHYGDEQGMLGAFGNDQHARETMFATQAAEYRHARLLGTSRTGADDKFDPAHPFYRLFAQLGQLRRDHAALRTGAMLIRPTAEPGLFAFSRIERGERIEYLAAFNNSRAATLTAAVATSQPAGATLALIFDSSSGGPRPPGAGSPAVTDPRSEIAGYPTANLTTDAHGAVRITLAPLQFAVWRAERPLAAPASAPTIALVTPAAGAELTFTAREVDDLVFPSRRELRAEVANSDGLAEVTFVLTRASRPGQVELLGTDDAPPYRVFWTPPADLAPGDKLEFTATVNDLRGHTAAATVGGITVAPAKIQFGIAHAKSPVFTTQPPAQLALAHGAELRLAAAATGSGELEYQWYRAGEIIPGATAATYVVPAAGTAHSGLYRVAVHNLAGTTLSAGTQVAVGSARLVRHPAFPSALVGARHIDVWLPPGYDAAAGERYPVIYMHDGQNLFDPATSYGGITWGVDEAMLKLLAQGAVRPAIVIGVWNSGATRFHEYMPQKAATGAVVAAYADGPTGPASALKSDAYLKFLVEELKPFVDRTYRTRPEREHTFVMGSSMGGLISAYAVCEYPQVFGGAGCVSTHWPAGDGAVIDYLARHVPAPGAHKFYFDFGTETLDAQYEPYQQRADAVMRAAGYAPGPRWMAKKFVGAEHSEKSWRERVDVPLKFLLAH
ncbi:MAG: hypothetical protein C0502_09580 [Opitutus sp.]|nr:hypothetical protein [Opitutus sp.]